MKQIIAIPKIKLDGTWYVLNGYSLPIAGSSVLGGIKVGAGLAITSDGTLSATGGGTADSVEWVNVLHKPTTISSYGITDAKIENGTITLGSNTITPLTSETYQGTVTSVQVQATSPVNSSTSTAQSSTLNTTISLSDAYGDTKNPYGSKTKNYVLAAPSNANGSPSFRALVASDIPDLSGMYLTSETYTGTVTSVRVQATSPVNSSTSTAQSTSLNTTISLSDAYGDTKNPYGSKTANYILAGPTNGSASAPTFRALVAADIPDLSGTYLTSETYTGTVTSVRVQATSPVNSSTSTEQTTSLNTTISLADAYGDTKNPYGSKTKNYVLAAPSNTNGSPSFRALVASDIPDLSGTYLTSETYTGTVTSVRVQATSPVNSSTSTAQSTTLNTTISLSDAYGDTKNPYGSKTANYVLAAPNGSAGSPSFRALVGADLPVATSSTLGAIKVGSGLSITDGVLSATGGGGSVTSVATGAGLTGGPITTTGTIKANLNSETSLGTIGTTAKLQAVGVDSNSKLAVSLSGYIASSSVGTVYVTSGTAPSSPLEGDIWIDLSESLSNANGVMV